MKYDIRPGTIVFGSWTVKEKIGEGSFGQVYEIQKQDFGEIYRSALKVITVPQNQSELEIVLAEGLSPAQAEAYFYSMVEDIVREFSIMAKLKGTGNVVNYEDHAVIRHQNGIGWDILIRMELLTPLLPYAYAHPFSRRDVIQLGIGMCRALELCQRYNIIHRDIKPENIFVSVNRDFKLGDFGVARTIERTTSGLSQKGTWNYMAPEVYSGSEYGFSVDIYSLGIVLYRLLNKNRTPFLPPAPDIITYHSREAALARRMSGERIPAPFYGRGRLGEIVLKACAFDPRDRYSSPAQMRQELEAILYDQNDAELIYPGGDELSIFENKYASHSATERVMQEAANTQYDPYRTRTSRNLRTPDSTASARPADRKAPAKKSASGKGKIALIIACAFLILASAAGGALLYLHQQQEKKTEQYLQLMTDADSLCETDPQRALDLYLEAHELFPEETAPSVSYAYALYLSRDYEACASYIEDDLALGKDFDPETQSKLSEILGAAYFEQGDYAAAASFFRLSAAGGTITVPAMRDYAVSLGRLGDVDMAREVLEQMIDAGASDDTTAYVRAETDYAMGNYLEAEEGFTSVMETSGDESLQQRSLRSLGELYRDCAGLDRVNQSPIRSPATKSAAVLSMGIEKFGLRYDSSMWEMLGLAYFESFHTDPEVGENYLVKAADCFNRVIELGVQKEHLYCNLYTIYYELKDYESAELSLTDFESAFPRSYMPHALRAMMLITIENEKPQSDRDYSSAYSEYEKAGELMQSSDDTTYYQQLESLIEQLRSGGWL